MATVIKPKRSETSGSAPTTSDLVAGEIAVNTADIKIYIIGSLNYRKYELFKSCRLHISCRPEYCCCPITS